MRHVNVVLQDDAIVFVYLLGGVCQPSDAPVGLLDPRHVPGIPDRRSGISVRAEQQAIVYEAAASAECGRGGVLFDVPKYFRLCRYCGDHRARRRAAIGASSLRGRPPDAAHSALSDPARSRHAGVPGYVTPIFRWPRFAWCPSHSCSARVWPVGRRAETSAYVRAPGRAMIAASE